MYRKLISLFLCHISYLNLTYKSIMNVILVNNFVANLFQTDYYKTMLQREKKIQQKFILSPFHCYNFVHMHQITYQLHSTCLEFAIHHSSNWTSLGELHPTIETNCNSKQ